MNERFSWIWFVNALLLVANSHSSNSSSWSLSLSVGWLVPSCDSSFGTLTKLSDTFTFKPLVHFVPTVL